MVGITLDYELFLELKKRHIDNLSGIINEFLKAYLDQPEEPKDIKGIDIKTRINLKEAELNQLKKDYDAKIKEIIKVREQKIKKGTLIPDYSYDWKPEEEL